MLGRRLAIHRIPARRPSPHNPPCLPSSNPPAPPTLHRSRPLAISLAADAAFQLLSYMTPPSRRDTPPPASFSPHRSRPLAISLAADAAFQDFYATARARSDTGTKCTRPEHCAAQPVIGQRPLE
jgi:hypothetical protein